MLKTLKIEFTKKTFLELIESLDYNTGATKILVKNLGGIATILDTILPEIKEDELDDLYIIGNLIFSTMGADTYKEDWENYLPILKKLPPKLFSILLINWCPKRHKDDLDDSVLSYLLTHYYESDLTKTIYNELSEIFEANEIEPKQFEQFKLDEHYRNELLEFKDLNFLDENKYKITIETNEIKDILCQIITGNKLDTEDKLKSFVEFVDYFAPSNYFDKKYKDLFIISIFESIQVNGEEWEEEEYLIWKEHFYNVNFEWGSDELNEQIKYSVKQEADHISKMLKLNPNYRHD
jgi:hypothetical protein